MFCKDCGKDIGFSEICPFCQTTTAVDKKGWFSKVIDFAKSQNVDVKKSFSINKSVSIKIINIKGQERTIETGDLQRDNINQLISQLGVSLSDTQDIQKTIDQLASQLGMSTSEVQNLLTRTKKTEVVKGPLKQVVCPKCKHTTAQQKGWCIYCGYELAQEKEPVVVDEVDKKILTEEVKEEQKTEEENKVKLKDSYKERLKEL